MRPSIERPEIASPRYSMTWPIPPPVPMRPITPRTTSFGAHPGRQLPVDLDGHRRGPDLGERLGCEHVLDLARADAEGERAKGAVGGGVAVPADDGHPGLGQAQLGADDVHDPLVAVPHRVADDAKLLAVGREDLELLGRHRVGERLVDVGGRDVVVGGGEGEIGAPHAPTGHPQAVEGLGRGDLVHQVQVDEEQVGLALRRPDHVRLPHLVGQGARDEAPVPAEPAVRMAISWTPPR